MKKFLFSLIFLLAVPLCWTVSAQETGRPRTLPFEIPHFSFMGLPIDGGPLPYVESLKEKGFTFVNKTGNIFILTGTFAGVSDCAIGVNVKDDFIWKVSVSFPTQMSWPTIKAQYEKFKRNYAEKYETKPQSVERLSPRFREGTGQEHWGFEDESSQWQSTFDVPNGFIILAVRYNRTQSNLYLVVDYVDKVNYLMKEQIDFEDI